MFAYCQEAVGVPVDAFKLISVGIGCLVAGKQGQVGRRSPVKAGEHQVFEMRQVGLGFATITHGSRRKTVHNFKL